VIELFNIEKTFNSGRQNQFTAIKGVNLKIELNKITVIKGPSGSGKTTLASIIGCMLRPTSGRIRIGDRETTSLPERFLAEIRSENFGFIFQKFNLINSISVLENIILPTYPMGIKHDRIKNRALGLLDKLEIGSKADQKVEYLSSGEQQRVAIARALINDPAIIIADEPTAHLDTDMAKKFIDIASQLLADKKTVLLTSHDPLVYESETVHRVIKLRDGRIVKET
jgi:putative ABC transport system ATP-binding protein